MRSFVFGYRGGEFEQVSEFIHTVQEALLGEGIDREYHCLSARQSEGLGGKIDADLHGRIVVHRAEQFLVRGRVHDDREQTVLQGVVAKDVSEGSADHRPEAEIYQRPGGVLAGAPAPEIGAGEQNSRAGKLGPVEDEIRPWPAFSIITPVVKKDLPEAGFHRSLQESSRSYLVRVDIFVRQRHKP